MSETSLTVHAFHKDEFAVDAKCQYLAVCPNAHYHDERRPVLYYHLKESPVCLRRFSFFECAYQRGLCFVGDNLLIFTPSKATIYEINMQGDLLRAIYTRTGGNCTNVHSDGVSIVVNIHGVACVYDYKTGDFKSVVPLEVCIMPVTIQGTELLQVFAGDAISYNLQDGSKTLLAFKDTYCKHVFRRGDVYIVQCEAEVKAFRVSGRILDTFRLLYGSIRKICICSDSDIVLLCCNGSFVKVKLWTSVRRAFVTICL